MGNKENDSIFVYLEEIKNNLPESIKADKKVVNDIIGELEAHIMDKVGDLSKQSDNDRDVVSIALEEMGDPARIARAYGQDDRYAFPSVDQGIQPDATTEQAVKNDENQSDAQVKPDLNSDGILQEESPTDLVRVAIESIKRINKFDKLLVLIFPVMLLLSYVANAQERLTIFPYVIAYVITLGIRLIYAFISFHKQPHSLIETFSAIYVYPKRLLIAGLFYAVYGGWILSGIQNVPTGYFMRVIGTLFMINGVAFLIRYDAALRNYTKTVKYMLILQIITELLLCVAFAETWFMPVAWEYSYVGFGLLSIEWISRVMLIIVIVTIVYQLVSIKKLNSLTRKNRDSRADRRNDAISNIARWFKKRNTFDKFLILVSPVSLVLFYFGNNDQSAIVLAIGFAYLIAVGFRLLEFLLKQPNLSGSLSKLYDYPVRFVAAGIISLYYGSYVFAPTDQFSQSYGLRALAVILIVNGAIFLIRYDAALRNYPKLVKYLLIPQIILESFMLVASLDVRASANPWEYDFIGFYMIPVRIWGVLMIIIIVGAIMVQLLSIRQINAVIHENSD